MCGILGVVGALFSEIDLDCIHHRGPDGRGLHILQSAGKDICLGHTRLAIQDLSPAGHQPMSSKDGRWWVTFNGEIYNHLELRKGLSNKFTDLGWRGQSDTETLVELISHYGLDASLQLLNGMYAFAALDMLEGKMHLVRDPFGIKPVYFAQFDGKFAFASEARALFKLGTPVSVDGQGLNSFLALRYTPSNKTLWQGVRRLPPGYVVCLDIETLVFRQQRFIQPTTSRFHGSIADAADAYRETLRAAVQRQLLADVPVGVLLSGGIDSALIAAMSKDAGHSLPCYTVGFDAGYHECEIDDAALTAKVLGLPFNYVRTHPDELCNSLAAIASAVEEPLGTTSIMPMWQLVQLARRDVTVVLTGQGSDEPWGGYFRYQVELIRRLLPISSLWRLGEKAIVLWLGRSDVVKRGLSSLSENGEREQILQACALFSFEERNALIGEDAKSSVADAVDGWLDWLAPVGDISGAERMMRIDTRMNLADDLLLYGDKVSMAFSLEARVPMLDIELVRFIESLPINYRIRWQQAKIVHKLMAERYLPPEIIHRKKKGFQVPFGTWSRTIWRAWIESTLFEGLRGLLHQHGVEKIWSEHLAGKTDRSRQIFALLMLALWHREHMR